MKKIIKNTIILFVITLVAGVGLGFVYNVTSDARKNQEEKTKLAAYESVMNGMDSFENVKLDSGCATFIKKNISKIEKDNNISTIKEFNASIDEAVLAKDKSGNDLGYIITVTDNEAYGGSLTMTVGIKTDGTVNGISFLTLSETPGLGMKAEDEDFYSQFKDKLVDTFEVVKNAPAADNEIESISGATITSKAMANGVNAALTYFRAELGGAQ